MRSIRYPTAGFALRAAAIAAGWLAAVPSAAAQEAVVPRPPIVERAWEYFPYAVSVWIVDDDSHPLRQIRPLIQQRVERDARLSDANAWRVSCQPAPESWNGRLVAALRAPSEEITRSLAETPSLQGQDKLIAVFLEPHRGGYRLLCRELDLATRQWGEVVQRQVDQYDALPGQCAAAFHAAFMPLIRIDRVATDNSVYGRLRGVALSRELGLDASGQLAEVPAAESPVWVKSSDVLLPVVRRNDREGLFAGAEVVAQTLLTIRQQEKSVLKCHMHTAQFAPLSGRVGARVQKYGLVVRPQGRRTRLQIISENPKNPAPLPGLDVLSRRAGDDQAPEIVLGKTDWKGSISIEPDPESIVRTVYVRNGARALKKFPVLPGLFEQLTVAVPDDNARVFAEGKVNGLLGQFLDLIAQRQILKTRIEIALERQQFEKAQDLFQKQLDRLPGRDEFSFRMLQVKEQLLNRRDADAKQRERIDRMFRAMDEVVGKFQEIDTTALLDRILNKQSTPPGEPAEGEAEPEPTEPQPAAKSPPPAQDVSEEF